MALHGSNILNVEATLNHWIDTQLAALTKPSWLPAFSVVFDEPETAMPTPSISVYHLGGVGRKRWQGNRAGGSSTGVAQFGLMEVSCWTSRGDEVGGQQVWAAQLRTLRAFLSEIFAGVSALVIADYLSDQTGGTATAFLVRFGDMEYQSTVPDPNPDIERARYLIRYDWTLRGSNQ